MKIPSTAIPFRNPASVGGSGVISPLMWPLIEEDVSSKTPESPRRSSLSVRHVLWIEDIWTLTAASFGMQIT